MTDRDRLLELARSIPRARIAVVGDFLLDHYVYGRPDRLSREAPVPVLAFEAEEEIPGGAGNTAANLAALGARVAALGVVGDDAAGAAIARMLSEARMDVSGLVRSAGGAYSTPTKTRILAGDRNTRRSQVVRLDRVPASPPSSPDLDRLACAVRGVAGESGALVVSDYGYGAVAGPVREAVLEAARRIPVVVDSHRRLLEFPGAAVLTPNEEEAAVHSGLPVGSDAACLAAARRLRELSGAGAVVLTRGHRGMVVASAQVEEALAAVGPSFAVDVTGAGDTVAATIGLALALGAEVPLAARLAACAAAVVVMKPGTATLTARELEDSIRRPPP